MAATDSPGTKLHRETGEKRHNTKTDYQYYRGWVNHSQQKLDYQLLGMFVGGFFFFLSKAEIPPKCLYYLHCRVSDEIKKSAIASTENI